MSASEDQHHTWNDRLIHSKLKHMCMPLKPVKFEMLLIQCFIKDWPFVHEFFEDLPVLLNLSMITDINASRRQGLGEWLQDWLDAFFTKLCKYDGFIHSLAFTLWSSSKKTDVNCIKTFKYSLSQVWKRWSNIKRIIERNDINLHTKQYLHSQAIWTGCILLWPW